MIYLPSAPFNSQYFLWKGWTFSEPFPFHEQDLKSSILWRNHSYSEFVTPSAMWLLEDTVPSSPHWSLAHRIFPTLLLWRSPSLWGIISNVGLSSPHLCSALWIVLFVNYCPMQKQIFSNEWWRIHSSGVIKCMECSVILSPFRKPTTVCSLWAPITSATKDSLSGLQYQTRVLAYRLALNPIRKPLCTNGIIFLVEYHSS